MLLPKEMFIPRDRFSFKLLVCLPGGLVAGRADEIRPGRIATPLPVNGAIAIAVAYAIAVAGVARQFTRPSTCDVTAPSSCAIVVLR